MKFKVPSGIIIALSSTVLAAILSAAAVVFSSYVNTELLPEQTVEIPAPTATTEELVAYCQKWASINMVYAPSCQGQWQLTDFETGNCDWKCIAPPAAVPATESAQPATSPTSETSE